MRVRRRGRLLPPRSMLTAFGPGSAALMVTAYALEARSRHWVGVFAGACLATAIYGTLTRAWIFAALEAVWSAIAFLRCRTASGEPRRFRQAVGGAMPAR